RRLRRLPRLPEHHPRPRRPRVPGGADPRHSRRELLPSPRRGGSLSAPVPSEQAQRFFDLLADRPPLLGEELHLHREAVRELCFATAGEPDEVASVQDLDADGIPSRLYHPAGGERDALVYFHGGGWVVQDLDTFDTTMRRLANEAGCAVLNVDYRL